MTVYQHFPWPYTQSKHARSEFQEALGQPLLVARLHSIAQQSMAAVRPSRCLALLVFILRPSHFPFLISFTSVAAFYTQNAWAPTTILPSAPKPSISTCTGPLSAT